MVATLPQRHQLRLEQALGQWSHWDCGVALSGKPAITAVLGPGHSNHSVQVTAPDGRAFVVRLDGVDTDHHGISRQAEWRALKRAHGQRLAPRPCYFNPDLGVLVCAYLPPDARQRQCPADTAHLLRGIHALPGVHFRLDLGERIAHYQRRCEQVAPRHLAELSPFEGPINRVLQWLRDGTDRQVLCHNDLLAANRLYSGGHLWSLDWEYCAMGSRWFDLAVVCSGDDLDDDDTAALLEAYLQRPPGEIDYLYLAHFGLLYRYLELLWFASVSPQATDWPHRLAALDSAARELVNRGNW
ncbi:choline/ethanolamine kinase family protein [Parahaliea mediterranea]|uniref:Phosphotransferase family protein n=1 Tax=Parahaliea mediterranea TaxID=651086 RepID=A0A939DBX7_9GAMM|nr:choline/ethanolamine kinase family protein [Parahaliea mediterranea]MBN7795413.1 phosphotransferase family protein [Parahaliea mediterranea]